MSPQSTVLAAEAVHVADTLHAAEAAGSYGLPAGVSLGTTIGVLLPLCIVTVALRGLPFAALRSFRESKLVAWLGMGMPVGVMSILVIYTAADRMDAPGGLASLLIAVAFTTLWHLWRRSATQSILLGTVFYVLLVNLVF